MGGRGGRLARTRVENERVEWSGGVEWRCETHERTAESRSQEGGEEEAEGRGRHEAAAEAAGVSLQRI